jgi:hypothetical protein
MFNEQIKPSGMFVPNTELAYSNGITNIAQIGWLGGIQDYDFNNVDLVNPFVDLRGFNNIKKMNDSPPLNRGLSWAFDNIDQTH